ncbi:MULTISPECIES: hypothetical protein [unclassified Novosphingobium]|uniref:hypothetical protein n=1 Tax=unclassified Novosphingobium TaxID=2644732 RepID=UPI000D2FAAE3|nr:MULTISPECIES: hypothetical protein [unclassified Novosphingobium]PTR07286.1 hypothetical protein C8K11_11682 [Novosphingobium sp. GV055]PUB00099.1 hypothetical protein C8K12_11682 [Novosphingobium sp. GV061]PUB15069.1 hypothetical protein C8K14_11682 [Novosphingobium sp. GV079]PUB39128.1 hypothetical protein C8K10_11682 [Novosphingobium sp. GV027]
MIVAVALIVALVVTLALTFGRFARSDTWRATVTPLASIIGSGFLICGPLLAREFGSAALGAMAVLLAIAYAAGAVIRFNIVHVESYLARASFNDPVAWLARLTQGVLALAYAVSVAYYLKLLAEFSLKPIAIAPALQPLAANIIVTVLIVLMTLLALGGSLRKVEHLAHGTVSLKIGIIAGLLVALALAWAIGGMQAALPPARLSFASVPMLLGLLITVQGFETSRYLGHAYPAALRVRTMRHAQWISSAIYLAFIALLTPFLSRAAATQGVAGILDIMELIAPALGVFVLIGAVASQLSAAVADSIGSGGLINEVSRRKISVPLAFLLAGALAIVIVWLTDPFEVVALSSRAFALFYALQCALALIVSIRNGVGTAAQRIGFGAIGLVCLVAAAVGAPAEG